MGKVKLRQHDPVIAPHGWNQEEKSFVNRIEHLFDTAYQKIGELTVEVEALKKKLEEMETNKDADD